MLNLVRARVQRGLMTEVLTLDDSISQPIVVKTGPHIQLWIVQKRKKRAMRDWYRKERELIRRVLAASGADICHANWTYEYGLAAVQQNLKPHLITVHDHAANCKKWHDARYTLLYFMTQAVFKRGRCFSAVSPYVATYVSLQSKRTVSVIPNILDEEMMRRSGGVAIPEESIVSAVNHYPLKNAKRALKAYALIRKCFPESHYIFTGAGAGPGEVLEQWAKQNNLSLGVHFFGAIPYEKMVQIIKNSAYVFHPSLEEAFGLPVAEAMWCEKPVVACRQARGVRWLLQHGNLGCMVDGLSPESMAEGLMNTMRVVRAGATRQNSSAGRIRDLCNVDRVLLGYDRIYKSLLELN